jgi:hypothetical protein
VVTVDDVRAVLAGLPRSSEVLVRDRVKFRVGQILYTDGFAFTRGVGWRRVGLPGRARTVAFAKGAVSRPHPGQSSAHTEGFNRRLRLPAT